MFVTKNCGLLWSVGHVRLGQYACHYSSHYVMLPGNNQSTLPVTPNNNSIGWEWQGQSLSRGPAATGGATAAEPQHGPAATTGSGAKTRATAAGSELQGRLQKQSQHSSVCRGPFASCSPSCLRTCPHPLPGSLQRARRAIRAWLLPAQLLPAWRVPTPGAQG